MKHSEMLNLNLPEDNDLINVGHISGNFEKLDSAFQTLPVKQEESKTDIDVMACPPYWTMHNATDEDIVYIDHNFFDEEFTLEAGQTIVHEIEEPENIRISSEVTIDYIWFIPASEAFSGGGGGGTSDYNKLNNLPTINNVEIKNNKTADDLGLVAKENGKGLSTNDFSNAYKSQLDGLDDALDAKLNANSVGVAGGVAELGNDGKVPSSQLPDPVAQKEYRIAEEASASYAKVYKLQQKNGETWSDISDSSSINIPKDMVVESGSVKECTTDNVPVSGYKKGDKYIDLVIANKADAHIYINVKDLIDNKAEGIQYSNITSELTATNVQSAIDEIAALAKGNESAISDINEALDDKVDETELSYITGLTRKNLLSLEKVSKTETGTLKFSVDKFTGTVRAVGTSGTSSSILEIKNAVVNEPVIISTGNSEASESGCYIDVYDSDWKNRTVVANTEVSRNKVGIIRVIAAANSTVDITLKPMVRKASITDSTFEPYRVSLQEQVDDSKTNILSTIVASSNAFASNAKTLEFQGIGKSLEKLIIEGKTVQDGTPSPSSPVDVKGVGDKCNNIFNYAKWSDAWSTAQSGMVSKDASGFTLTATANDCYTKTHNVVACLISGYTVGKTYTLSWKANNSIGGNVYVFDSNGNTIKSANNSSTKSITFTATTTSIQLRFGVAASGASIRYYDIKIEEGSTATKFYPYDKRNMYEIPISTGNTTKNVYLDAPLFNTEILDTESGKVSKKYGLTILNGSEDWKYENVSIGDNYYIQSSTGLFSNAKGASTVICNYQKSTSAAAAAENAYISNGGAFNFQTQGYSHSVDNLKNALRANPMIVVYQLATATKETFEAPEIATTVGNNTLSINTDVTPASISVTSFGEYYSKTEVDKMLAEKLSSKTDNVYTDTAIGANVYNIYDFTKVSEVRACNYTYNADGSLSLTSNGNWTRFYTKVKTIPHKTYTLWLDISESTAPNCNFEVYDLKSDTRLLYKTTALATGVIKIDFTSYSDNTEVRIMVNNSATSSTTHSITLKPMVYLSEFGEKPFEKAVEPLQMQLERLEAKVAALEGK